MNAVLLSTRCAIAVFGLCALLGSFSSVIAQVTTGTILGTVTDGTGAALPGATVTVKRIETDGTRGLATDGQGRYRADALEPGTYEVTVELA